MSENLLIPEEQYLTAGVHIGTQIKSKDMVPFIFRIRNDGLYILNIAKTNERIAIAGKFLAKFEPSEILILAQRQYAQKPASLMAETIGAKSISGRFIPGTLTNPSLAGYIEPQVIFLNDPIADSQALKEALQVGVPIIALCDANNQISFIDLVIPTNNKGRKALALVYWLLTREILKSRGDLKSYEDYSFKVEDFEAPI
ncbi:MAG: 30S ribosomal protein S2 [Thermoplasmata archaeon]